MAMTSEEIIAGLIMVGEQDFAHVRQCLKAAGFALPRDGETALAWCKRQAQEGSAEGQYLFASFLFLGLFCDKDDNAAIEWFQRAADQRYAPAIKRLSGFYAEGWGTLQANPTKSLQLLHEAINMGYAPAMASLAVQYDHGLGVPQSRELAMKYFRDAAVLGDAYSQCALGLKLLEDSKSDPAKEREGLAWVWRAAKQDYASAHRQLGYFYKSGDHGLPEDQVQSRYHHDLADKLETGEAQ